jgi:heat shock protein HslJ
MSIVIFALFTSSCKTKKVKNQVENISVESVTTEKNSISDFSGKHWKLVELFGNQVIIGENAPEAHIIFDAGDNRFSGNAGCNRMSGSYQIKTPDRITFSQVATTKMMCINGIEKEEKFLQVLNTADSYVIKNDTLILNRARMAPLARLVAVD